jgi:hypothetical protein
MIGFTRSITINAAGDELRRYLNPSLLVGEHTTIDCPPCF